MNHLHTLSATEIVAAIATGKTNAQAVAEAYLDQITIREPEVQAWQYLDRDQVLQQARHIDAQNAKGTFAQAASARSAQYPNFTGNALRGVPIGFKDIIDTADMPTEYGTPIHRGHRPKIDAACVALTKHAQANVFGKTVTTEFANRFPGKTRNPFDPERTPGGSSSGSAAAVGAGMVPLAVGTQTTSSTIRPASFCGVVGYRPTWGDMRCHGVMEASASLDSLGLFAHTVDDISLLRDVIVGVPVTSLPERDLKGLRVGVAHQSVWDQCDASTQASLQDCADRLAAAGANVSTVPDTAFPVDFGLLEDAHRWVSSFEFARNRRWEIDHHWDAISTFLRENRIHDGLTCSFDTYRAARDLLERCRLQMDLLFSHYDVLQVPAAGGEAPIGLSSTGNIVFCTSWSALHVPALSLPLYQGPNGLPVGVQFVAKRGDDQALFASAKAIMQAANQRNG